jgi:hypothetical protein
MIILPTLRGSFASGGLDPNAWDYINYITNVIDSVSVSPMQRLAISTFFKTGKRQGWLSSIKRIYLPIWGSAGANSLCLVSLEAGSFSGTLNYGNGFVQSNGTTGFFNTLYSVNNVSTSSAHVFSLCHVAPTTFVGEQFGVQSGATRVSVAGSNSTAIRGFHGTSILSLTVTATQQRGIISQSTTGITERRLTRTGGSGVSHSITSSASNTQPTFGNFQAMRTATNYTNAGLGAYGVGNGLSATNQDLFTVALRNLWQTCTGFTLP